MKEGIGSACVVRCMLHDKDLPKSFRAKVTNTVIFLQNKPSTTTVKHITPFESWFGYKPTMSFLKYLGSFFTYVPQMKCEKLDRRLIPGIFVGYSIVSKAYKIFHPQLKRQS